MEKITENLVYGKNLDFSYLNIFYEIKLIESVKNWSVVR